jgi:hypothetical protein
MEERMPKRILVGHPNIILETMLEVAQKEGFTFESDLDSYIGEDIGWAEVHGHLYGKEDIKKARFQLNQCPGCCAILVVSYVVVYPWTQNNFDKVIQIIEAAAFEAGFGSVMQTQTVPAYSKMFWKQEPWIMCLERGWKASEAFMNAKSGNLVTYLTKSLDQKGKKDGLEVLSQPPAGS